MTTQEIPSSMRAWQFSSTVDGLEKHLQLKNAVTVPQPKPDQHLVKVLVVGVNPMDYKGAEIQFVHRMAIPKPATPGFDFAGRIVKPAKDSGLREGDIVFGAAGSPFAGGALAEYAVVNAKEVALTPQGLSLQDAASIPMAGLTAWQSLMSDIKPGSRVFINGGSGGVGQFGIQIAKQAGAHVTASCSTANIERCRSLGADEILDYRQSPVLSQLQASAKDGRPFDHVVDYAGADFNLYWKCHTYTTPNAKYIFTAANPSLSFFSFFLQAMLIPSFLGGAKRKLVVPYAEVKVEQLTQIGKWIAEGKAKSVVAERYEMDDALDAYRSSKTGRAKGKIIIEVA